MNAPAFTPGPWVAEMGDHGRYHIEAYAPGYAVICSRSDWTHRATESEANARLIAAAPRMYARIAALAADGDAEAVEILEAVNGRN